MGWQGDFEAKLGDLVYQPLHLDFGRTLVEIAGAEVLVNGSVLEHVVDGGEQRSGDGANGFFAGHVCFATGKTAPCSSCLFFRLAAQAHCTSMVLSHGAPLRRRVRLRLSEIGTDMSRSPRLAIRGLGGACAPARMKAGKRKRTRLRKGAPWLKTMLVQCAWAAKRKKDSYYQGAVFSGCKADVARKKPFAPSPLLCSPPSTTCQGRTIHQDLGSGYFDQRPPEIKVKRFGKPDRQAWLRSHLAAHRQGGLKMQKRKKEKSMP